MPKTTFQFRVFLSSFFAFLLFFSLPSQAGAGFKETVKVEDASSVISVDNQQLRGRSSRALKETQRADTLAELQAENAVLKERLKQQAAERAKLAKELERMKRKLSGLIDLLDETSQKEISAVETPQEVKEKSAFRSQPQRVEKQVKKQDVEPSNSVVIVGKALEEPEKPSGEKSEDKRVDEASLVPQPKENPAPRVVPEVSDDPLYISLPPIDDSYQAFILGDSLASGLWQGLHQNFRNETTHNIEIVKKAKANTGIVRDDRFDWMNNVEQIADLNEFQIAIMMFGANDAQTIRENGKRHHFGTEGWERLYRQRIDRMVKALQRKNVAIYWVGLPNVRIPSLRKNYLHFNSIFKEKAEEHGFHYIETWNVTNDENGNWQSSGKTLRGKRAVLRAKDGTHFTSSGYRVLATFPEKVLRDDLQQARLSRLYKRASNGSN